MKIQFMRFLRLVPVFLGFFILFFFLNTGFYEKPLWLVLQATFFALVAVLMFLRKIKKVWLIYFFFFLFVGMVVSILFEGVFVAEVLGSTGFGLIIILLISYLPHLVRDGYLKKW